MLAAMTFALLVLMCRSWQFIRSALTFSDLPCTRLELKTSNAPVTGTLYGDMRAYSIQSHTSNAACNLPANAVYPELEKSLSVHTSNGRIHIDFVR